MKHNYDFIAIGDITTDAFIRIKDASVTCDVNREHCMLCMRFGDKIPYEEVFIVRAVGNSPNAAVSASRLGLKSAIVTDLGGDEAGREAIDKLTSEHVGTEFVSVHKNQKTNYHYVLWYEEERTILIKHEEYDYELPNIDEPRWVYLSSMAENSLALHNKIQKYLDSHPDIKFAFQPGTYQMKFGKEKLAYFYKRADVFVCNKEEYQRILGTEESDIKKLMSMMRDLGSNIVVLSDGIKGAYSYDGNEYLFMRYYPDPKPPFERTGAGDAFTSTVVSALALGHDIRTALMWGPINSMSVVQHVGAQAGLLTRPELEAWLSKAPEDYVPKVI